MFAGNRLAELRAKAGLTQADVGAVCGVSKSAIGFWELGVNVPPLEKAAAVAALYHEPITRIWPMLAPNVIRSKMGF